MQLPENYYELFGVEPALIPNKLAIRKQFFSLSKQYHPDKYAQEDAKTQDAILALSAHINNAYKTLMDDMLAMEYALLQQGIVHADEKYALPSTFLMEMMESNEALEDAVAAGDTNKILEQQLAIQAIKDVLDKQMQPMVASNIAALKPEDLQLAKEYYYKKKYLNRILAAEQ